MEQLVGALAAISLSLAAALTLIVRNMISVSPRKINGNGIRNEYDERINRLLEISETNSKNVQNLIDSLKDLKNTYDMHENNEQHREDISSKDHKNYVNKLNDNEERIISILEKVTDNGRAAYLNCPVIKSI